MATRMLRYESRHELERNLPLDLHRYVGNGVFVEDLSPTGEAIHVHLGLEVPELLIDPGGGDSLVSFLQLRKVSSIRFSWDGEALRAARIDRDAFFQHAEERRQDLVVRAEQIMVNAAKNELVRVQPIGSGLNPIREILVYVNEQHSLAANIVEKGKQGKYLPMLKALGYLTESKGTYFPGPELQKFLHSQGKLQGSPEFYSALMGEVLNRGYREIREGFKILHLVPIVRLANAYYWTCQRIGRTLTFAVEDFRLYLRHYHPSYNMHLLKIQNHLVDMAGASMIAKHGNHYTAVPDVWDRYQTLAARQRTLA